MEFDIAKKEDSLAVAKIHREEIKDSFLGSLGISFLNNLYRAIIENRGNSFCIVAKEGNETLGFVAGIINVKKFYFYLFSHYFFSVALSITKKAFNYRAIKSVVENFFYPKDTKNLPEAELFAIAVKGSMQGKGLGSMLINEFVKKMRNLGQNSFKALVGESDAKLNFYTKNGFEVARQIKLHGDQVSTLFVYKIK